MECGEGDVLVAALARFRKAWPGMRQVDAANVVADGGRA
jgi:hypothetical protein